MRGAGGWVGAAKACSGAEEAASAVSKGHAAVGAWCKGGMRSQNGCARPPCGLPGRLVACMSAEQEVHAARCPPLCLPNSNHPHRHTHLSLLLLALWLAQHRGAPRDAHCEACPTRSPRHAARGLRAPFPHPSCARALVTNRISSALRLACACENLCPSKHCHGFTTPRTKPVSHVRVSPLLQGWSHIG